MTFWAVEIIEVEGEAQKNNVHLFTAIVELPCALRMEEDTLTEAGQLHGELSAEETGRDEGDKELLDEAPSPGFRCRRHMEVLWWGLLDLIERAHHNFSKQRGSFIYILLGCCDCKIGRFIFHSVQFMEIVLATIHLHQWQVYWHAFLYESDTERERCYLE